MSLTKAITHTLKEETFAVSRFLAKNFQKT